MQEGEGSVEAVALACVEEVVGVEIVGVVSTGGSVEVEFSELQFAVDGVARLHVGSCAIDGFHLLEELLQFVK